MWRYLFILIFFFFFFNGDCILFYIANEDELQSIEDNQSFITAVILVILMHTLIASNVYFIPL